MYNIREVHDDNYYCSFISKRQLREFFFPFIFGNPAERRHFFFSRRVSIEKPWNFVNFFVIFSLSSTSIIAYRLPVGVYERVRKRSLRRKNCLSLKDTYVRNYITRLWWESGSETGSKKKKKNEWEKSVRRLEWVKEWGKKKTASSTGIPLQEG